MKSAYPYHYHCKNEETFYIISGSGTLKTPEGEMAVEAGDLLFFPADAGGAHKLTNTSPAEMLTYIDFDTNNDVEAVIYPDSNKIGIWGSGTNKVFQVEDQVDYYDGE
ncbi:cupin domain-containing protein [Hungatella effluvii]|nr:cupin domain-containing protein [Hungatella effluvii]